jgi:hypothetical protein
MGTRIKPAIVLPTVRQPDKWTFSVRIEGPDQKLSGIFVAAELKFRSASEAKAAMRTFCIAANNVLPEGKV